MSIQDFRAMIVGLRYAVLLAAVRVAHEQKIKAYGPGAGLTAEEIKATMSNASEAFAAAVLAQPRSSR